MGQRGLGGRVRRGHEEAGALVRVGDADGAGAGRGEPVRWHGCELGVGRGECDGARGVDESDGESGANGEESDGESEEGEVCGVSGGLETFS